MTASRLLSCLTGLSLISAAHATEYVVPAKADVGAFFAKLPADATYISFSAAAKYHSSGDIVLPPKAVLVIDGKGCTLTLGAASNGFTDPVADMGEAMKRASCRYIIRDFGRIVGGRKAIDLQATYDSVVENCDLASQTQAAIDLRFCLMARLSNILVTNPGYQGIVLRQGDWKGATGMNSQCNSSVLDQCRVYASRTTANAFTILNSGGVRMTNCISEGSPVDYDIFLSATLDGDESRPATNPVVKSFMLSDFHIEHQVRKASIHVNMPAKAIVDLENVYWNGPQKAPVIAYTGGQLNVSNIGWWDPGFYIATRVSAPRINILRAHSGMTVDEKKTVVNNRSGILRLVDPLPNNTQLKLAYVRVRDRSM
jgi:hypothetical protein